MRMRGLIVPAFLAAIALVILMNSAYVESYIIGTASSLLYLGFLGYLLGNEFLRDEKKTFTRVLLGIFVAISLLILVGTPIIAFYSLDFLGFAVILYAPLGLLVTYKLLWRRSVKNETRETESLGSLPYFSPAYAIFFVLMAYCTFLLVTARSGWVHGTVWDAVSPAFFYWYFLVSIVLIGIIFYSRTRAASKMLLIIMFAVLSSTVIAVVFYPGNFGDPFDHMAYARTIFLYGNLRHRELGLWFTYWLLREKGLALLTAIFAKMLMIDIYWVHTFVTPVFWGIFVPLSAYKITQFIDRRERVSLLAALLTAPLVLFIIWACRSTGNGLGYAVSFASLYFILRYMKSTEKSIVRLLLALLITVVSGLIHPLTGVMSLSFLFLAVALRRYEVIKLGGFRKALILVVIAFFVCVSIFPALYQLNNMVYLYFAPAGVREAYEKEIITFSLPKLLRTDVWVLIFGEFVNYSFKDLVLRGLVPFIGVVGLAYSVGKRRERGGVAALFMLLAFLICIIDFAMQQYAMVNVLFGPGRILIFRDFIVIPFAAVAINCVIEFFNQSSSNTPAGSVSLMKRWVMKVSPRYIVAGVLLGISLSAFATSSIYRAYLPFSGLQPTQLEVDAVKYIDEHTVGRYVVVTPPRPDMAMIGKGFYGLYNPPKTFLYGKYSDRAVSVAEVVDYMRTYEAEVGYFVVSSFGGTPDLDKVLTEALRMYGLVKVLSNENGIIYIFQYKMPPLPVSSDVMVFYWETPPSYIVQNDLMRAVFNPVTSSLSVEDYWGDLYESIELNEVSLDGKPLGNFTAIEYYDPSSDAWPRWEQGMEVPQSPALAEQFKFRILFESDSLIGVVKRGIASLQLWWEGAKPSALNLLVGDFERIYIPGLVGGENSYSVTSRDYGLLYTASLTDNIVLRPAYKSEIESSTLSFSEIAGYCNLTITKGGLEYDLYVDNKADVDQWAYVEVWLPDEVFGGIYPPISYSVDGGNTWTYVVRSHAPIKTVGGAYVNWMFTVPRSSSETPKVWTYSTAGAGGTFILPGNFTESGGGQNRLFFGIYLPAGDKALVKLGSSIYGCRPLKVTYLFDDSDQASYGLGKLNEGFLKLYDYGGSVYVGGLAFNATPTSLEITQDENGEITSMRVAIPPNVSFFLLSSKGVNTVTDADGNGIPDSIEETPGL